MGNRPAFTHLMWGRSPVSLSQAQGIALSQSKSLRQYRMAADTSPDGASCYSITPRLARNEKLSDAQEKMVKLLDCYLRQTIPITDELIVYRGCSANELAELPGNAYPSFLSASTKIDEAFKFMRGCLVRIICPVGTKMLQVSPVQTECASLEHDEILLPRNIRLRKEKWNLVLTDTQLVLLQAKQINQFETWTLTNNRR
ncbi:MAG: hypothetical protein WCH61_02365, partial [bacterium]